MNTFALSKLRLTPLFLLYIFLPLTSHVGLTKARWQKIIFYRFFPILFFSFFEEMTIWAFYLIIFSNEKCLDRHFFKG